MLLTATNIVGIVAIIGMAAVVFDMDFGLGDREAVAAIATLINLGVFIFADPLANSDNFVRLAVVFGPFLAEVMQTYIEEA